MKRIYFLLAIALSSVCFLSGQTQFQKLYDDEPSIEVFIDEASNGDVLFVSDSYNDYDGHRIIVQRLNTSGSVLQAKAVSKVGGFSYRPNRIKATSDNGLLVMGYFSEPLSGVDSVFVLKLNTDLTIGWGREFQYDTDFHNVEGAIETADGGFIVYGLYETSVEFSSNIFLVKFNSSGDKVWSRLVGSQLDGAFMHVAGITESANGDLWLGGSTRFNSEGSWSALLNSSGVLQSVLFYDTHNLTDSQPEPFAMHEQSNGNRDIFYKNTSFQDGSVLIVLRTNATGVPILTKRYFINYINGGTFTHVRQTSSGNYLLAGNHFPDAINFYASGTAMELDVSLNVVWAKSYGTGYIEYFDGILPMADGGFLLGGFADPNMVIISPSENGLFPWLVKTTTMGEAECLSWNLPVTTNTATPSSNVYQLAGAAGPETPTTSWNNFDLSTTISTVPCNPTSIVESDETLFSVYPNPTSGALTLELERAIPGGQLTLKDLLGRTIMDRQIGVEESIHLTIETPPGVYLLSLTTSEGGIITKRIIMD